MYNLYYLYHHYPYYVSMNQLYNGYSPYRGYYYPNSTHTQIYPVDYERQETDFGGNPYVVNIENAAEKNNTFRTAIWTGGHLQATLMSIGVGEEVGLESHPHTDQFIRIEDGEGVVMMGDQKNRLDFKRNVGEDFAIFIPAGKWHNLLNTGSKPMKLYTIYAPPEHPKGTIHETKAIAEAAEGLHG